MTTPTLNTIGLIACFAGFVLLFRYGMPFRVKTGGVTYIITHTIIETEKALEARYTKLGWLGFALVGIGTVFQIWGNWA